MQSLFKHLAIGVTASTLLLGPGVAFAQELPGGGGSGAGGFLTTSSTTTGPILTTAGIVILIVMLAKPKKGARALQLYLNENQQEVVASLHTSAASGSEDLAAIFGVSPEHRSDFAALIQQERATLAPLIASEHVSEADALTFGLHIAQQMAQHPTLTLDVERTLQGSDFTMQDLLSM